MLSLFTILGINIASTGGGAGTRAPISSAGDTKDDNILMKTFVLRPQQTPAPE